MTYPIHKVAKEIEDLHGFGTLPSTRKELLAILKAFGEARELEAYRDAEDTWKRYAVHAKKEAAESMRQECLNILDELASAKRRCSDGNKGHDDRWCGECEVMRDAYDFAEQEIKLIGAYDKSKSTILDTTHGAKSDDFVEGER
jgi:hypothetical protein